MLLGCVEGCHWLATNLLVTLVILHVVASDSSNFNCVAGLDSAGATVPKGDIVLQVGSSLEIFCNLNLSHEDAQGRNASSLVFYRNDKKVSSEFVEVINATTIRLFKEKPPASTDMYYCKLEGPKDLIGICLNMVAIGFKPQEVKDFSCISHNWQNLTCRWIKPENPIKTTYKLHFYLPGRAGKRLLFNCPEDNDKTSELKKKLQKNEELCFWDLYSEPHYRQPYEYYYFEMRGSNPLGEIKFDPIKFHHYSHVIPSPPEKLTVENTTHNSAFLTWDVPFPMQIFPPGVHTRMVYQSTYDNNERWHVANTSYLSDHLANQTYHLAPLSYANTLYDVRVYLRSAFAVGDDKWSHYASVTFKTPPTVPGAPPETVIGSFEVIPDAGTRDVYVYWRQVPPTLHNGDKFDYKVISVKENGIERYLEYNHSSAYAKFKGLTYNTYEFSIVSTNIVGDSLTKSVVHVPTKEDMPKEPVSFTKIAFHDGIYELSWKAPSESPNIESYTIFWCLNGRDRPYQCNGLLNWTVVPANVTLKNITVPDDSKIYQFAISANTKNASSGMVWASCTVIHNKVVDKMKSVWINRIGSTFIEVGWKLECSDRIGRVEAFEIGFCPIVSPRETACKEPLQTIKLEPSERQFHGNVTGLRPYTTYMVNIAILTNNGKGTPSDPLFNTTMEAAPEPPTNVTVTEVTNSSMTVHWIPPAAMNGVLRFYKIHYSFRHTDLYRKVETKNVTSFVLDNLTSFTKYKISVMACTVDCSERSIPIEVITRIGNPGKLETPQAKFLNDSQVLVNWGFPKDGERGGKLDFYEVRVQQFDGAGNSTPHVFKSTDNVSQIPIPECSKDHSRVKYTFWVRAVNRGEKNETYYGPWSDPGETTCYSSGPTLAVKITIYVVGFLVVTALCIAVACVGKRVWKCCKEMQQVEVKLPPGLAPVGDKEKDQDYPIDVTWTSGDHDHHLTGKVRTSADEELLLKKKEKKEERHGRNPSGDSSGCSSGHESVSSSLTSGTQISSDSGTEVDQVSSAACLYSQPLLS
ncbi:hypothetical protein R5R35_014563 [Gryllus longicercus]|uniref:Fibronectin type-III domain-containing protein n=1 Tax=Gryllus longicercus TaxID=2509291 RepID=A0AAN9YWF8_9ORTH